MLQEKISLYLMRASAKRFRKIYFFSHLHINLGHVLLHLSYGNIQPIVQVNVIILGLCVLLFEQEAQSTFPVASFLIHLPTAIFLVSFQASAVPGRSAHAGHTMLCVRHGVELCYRTGQTAQSVGQRRQTFSLHYRRSTPDVEKRLKRWSDTPAWSPFTLNEKQLLKWHLCNQSAKWQKDTKMVV